MSPTEKMRRLSESALGSVFDTIWIVMLRSLNGLIGGYVFGFFCGNIWRAIAQYGHFPADLTAATLGCFLGFLSVFIRGVQND